MADFTEKDIGRSVFFTDYGTTPNTGHKKYSQDWDVPFKELGTKFKITYVDNSMGNWGYLVLELSGKSHHFPKCHWKCLTRAARVEEE